MLEKMLVTSPIFYTNSDPHIGAAHTMILCDFIKRSHEKIGYDVFLSVGTDEHGDKILQAANACGKDPMDFVDEKCKVFRDLADKLTISYDRFIRTTEKQHIDTVQSIWKVLEEKGYIYKGKYRGYYSFRDETFFQLQELIEGKAPTGAEVIFLEEECFFIAFSRIDIDWLTENFTVPGNRINQIKEFVKNGFRDLCISRKSQWGIQIQNDSRTIYVWFDALINYLTVCDYPQLKYWKNVVHVVGKDILTFHALYWPAILKFAGIELPKNIVCHNWWIFKGEKMSKSIGNIIDPFEIIKIYGEIPFRLYCLKENLIHADQEFSIKDLLDTYENFFISKFCNLIHRVFSLAKRNSQMHLEKDLNLYRSDFEKSIRTYNSREYFYKFFEICDSLNREVEEKIIWKNVHHCYEMVKKINSLIDYIHVIIPNFPADIYENSKQFTNIRE